MITDSYSDTTQHVHTIWRIYNVSFHIRVAGSTDTMSYGETTQQCLSCKGFDTTGDKSTTLSRKESNTCSAPISQLLYIYIYDKGFCKFSSCFDFGLLTGVLMPRI